MKYRHSFHAGNFADVHKHVTLLSLLAALKKKDKGLFFLDTHAGRGCYDLSTPTAEAAAGIGRFLAAAHEVPELKEYAQRLGEFRTQPGQRYGYPGSPLVAALALRPQDRAVFVELQGSESHALEQALSAAVPARGAGGGLRVERGDGFERLRALLPPPERRGLTFIDPPYEETREDFAHLTAALAEALRRFPTGVFAAWYPIKEQRSSAAWLAGCARTLTAPALVSELWLYPRDSRVGLNGSGLLIVNPPWLVRERMQVWLPALEACLAPGAGAGTAVRMLSESPA
jgi:23S rRNA (adenine2030-N6)-methyltransferase